MKFFVQIENNSFHFTCVRRDKTSASISINLIATVRSLEYRNLKEFLGFLTLNLPIIVGI
jgi:hypothetical protein